MSKAVPEQVEHGFAPIPQGYAESKYVSEKTLGKAAKAGVPVTVAWMGQVAGPTSAAGKWNETDWLPRIISTSKLVNKIPNSVSNIHGDDLDWVPVDKAAQICVELLFTRLSSHHEERLGVYHLINPQTVPWSKMVPLIQSHFEQKGMSLEAVPLDTWVDAARNYGLTQGDTPVSALLDHFGQLSKRYALDQTKTLTHSMSMAKL